MAKRNHSGTREEARCKVGLAGAETFIEQARYLLALMRPVAEKCAAGAVGYMDAVDKTLRRATRAKQVLTWNAALAEAWALLGKLSHELEEAEEGNPSFHLWGLFWGVEATIQRGEEWVRDERCIMFGAQAAATPADFMAGVELMARMQEQAEALEGTDEGDYEARFRAGRPQTVFALPLLEELFAHPERRYGFAAALSSRLMHDDSSAQMREWTYLDNIHGPHTDYADLQQPEDAKAR